MLYALCRFSYKVNIWKEDVDNINQLFKEDLEKPIVVIIASARLFKWLCKFDGIFLKYYHSNYTLIIYVAQSLLFFPIIRYCEDIYTTIDEVVRELRFRGCR